MPDGTPAPAAAHSRGLRLGNITVPWWAVGLGAVGVGLVGFLVYRNMKAGQPTAASGSSAGTPTSPGVSSQAVPTAATLVPLPYPTGSTTSGQTATAASGIAASLAPQWQFGANPPSQFVWEPTSQGISSALAQGVQFPNQAYAATGGMSSAVSEGAGTLGAYGWQWAPVPSGMTAQQYAQYLNTQGASNPSAASLYGTQLSGQAA